MIGRVLLPLAVVLSLASDGICMTLSGTVVGPDGKTPAKGIIVQAEHHENRHAENPDTFVEKKVTDDNGRFSLELPEAKAQYMLFLADDKGHIFTGYAHVGESTDYGTIVLQRGCSLSGVVRDTAGKPLPNAELVLDIRLQKYTCSHFMEAARMRTDAKGAFVFNDLSPAEYSYRIVSPGHVAKDGVCRVSDDPAYVEIRLEQPTIVKGRVVDDQGNPVADVKVSASRERYALTDSNGNYALKDLVAGPVNIKVSGKGYVVKDGGGIPVKCEKGAEVTKDITVVLAGSLRIVLEAGEAGVVMPGDLALSIASRAGSMRNRYSSHMNAAVRENTAVFSNIPAGNFEITIQNDDTARCATNVTVVGGQETRQTLTLTRVLTLKGTVVDEDGKPVNNAGISLRSVPEKEAGRMSGRISRGGMDEWKHGRSDAGGEFKVAGLRPGKKEITVSHADFASTNRAVELADSNLTLQPFVMTRGLKISGSILEADGKAAANIKVQASFRPSATDGRAAMRRSFGGSKSANVQTDGSFTMVGLDPGKYALQFNDSGSGEMEASLENVEAGSDDVMVTLARKHVVGIEVSGPDGKPMKGVRINVTRREGNRSSSRVFRSGQEDKATDADGKFTLTLREGAKFVVTFSRYPMLTQTTTIDLGAGAQPSASPLKVTMERGCRVTGTVVGNRGAPAPGLSVRASAGTGEFGDVYSGIPMDEEWDGTGQEDGEESPAPRRPKPTDAKGRFTLEGVPAGVVKLTVSSRTNNQQKVIASKEVMVVKGKPLDVKIELSQTGSVKGRVLDADGKPLEGCQVMLMSPANTMSRHNMETDESGAFAFTDVAAGKYMAMWYDVRGGNGTPSTPVSVEVTMGKTAELTLGPRKATAGGMTVSGVITRNDKPLAGGALTFMQVPSEKANMFEMMGAYRQPIQAEVSSNGTFTVTGVSTGLHCYFYSGAPAEEGNDEEPPDMPFGGSGNLTFEASKTNIVINIGGLAVTGVVTGPDGKPASGAYVMMMPPGKRSVLTQMQMKYGLTDATGKYKVENVEPGSYDISVRHQEFGTTALLKTTVSASANSFDFKLGGGVTVSGRVSDDTGNALQGATVFAVPDGVEVDEMMEGGYGASDETGDFSLDPPLSPGKYKIFVMKAGRAVEASVITLPTTTNHNAALAVGGDISVTAKEKGKAAEGRNVNVRTDKGVEVLRLRNAGMLDMTPMGRCSISATDQQGKTTIRGLRPGKYTVTADGSKASVTVEVKQLATAEVTLNL